MANDPPLLGSSHALTCTIADASTRVARPLRRVRRTAGHAGAQRATAQAAPPTPPSAATARTQLAALTVGRGVVRRLQPGPVPALDHPERFLQHPREVLKRDGTNVVTNSSLRRHQRHLVRPRTTARPGPPPPTSTSTTSCRSPRRGSSGASSWTTAQRQAFANDLTRPQLIAVTDNVNQAKGDQDPAKWLPPVASYHCTYARMWVSVKSTYKLTVDSAEKSALSGILNGC